MGFFRDILTDIRERLKYNKRVLIRNDSLVDAARIESDAKIRLAELENANKIRLAEMDSERLEAWRAAQLEIIQAQALAQIAVDRARAEGLTTVANQFVALQEKLSDFAQKRLEMIETCALPIIADIERHYDEFGEKISARRDKYNRQDLPQLLALPGQFPAGSDERALFMEQIRHDMAQHNHFIITQTDALKEQQISVLQSFLAAKAETLEQLQRITENFLPQGQATLQALPGANVRALPPDT